MTPLENLLHWTVVAMFGLGLLGYVAACGLHLSSVNAPSRRLAWNWLGHFQNSRRIRKMPGRKCRSRRW